MSYLVHRALIPAALVLVVAACAAPTRTDTASLPPVTTTSTLPPVTTSIAPTTSTTVPVEPGPDVIAWLNPDAAAGTLTEAVAGWTGVGTVALVSGEDALAEFAALYAGRPDLVADVDPADLPSSLRIDLSHPSYLAEVASQLRALSDVSDVTTSVTPTCNPFSGWNIVVFVADDRELTRLRNELAETEDVSDVTVVGRDEAHAEYLARFGGLSDLASLVTVQDMAVSLRAKSENPVSLTLLGRRLATDDAVKGLQVLPPGAPDCSF
ncbi:MAG: permease-like cell division protein FtsX [Acidimicrobiia bacterium]|nr:permease-like cell division protein FtsX [Acidimicrobiia bacterium]